MILQTLNLLRCPKVLGNIQRFRKGTGPKGLSRGIHPIYRFAKFQHDWTIFYFSRLPQGFREKLDPRAQKERFLKNEKSILSDFHPIYK